MRFVINIKLQNLISFEEEQKCCLHNQESLDIENDRNMILGYWSFGKNIVNFMLL